MTTSTTQDYSDTMEREAYNDVIRAMQTRMSMGEYFNLKDLEIERLNDALKYFRNDQLQKMMRETDGGKA